MDPCPVLVGRQQELAALRQLLSAGGGVAVVSGEAGIGKSRLIREFATEAEDLGRIVLWGRPEEVAQPGPYALIADLLESIVERGNSDVKRDVRALEAELLRAPGFEEQRSPPAPRSVAAEVRGLVAQLGKPPLIILEDLHWADEVSHSVVLHISRAAQDDGHVVVLSSRSEGAISEASLSRLTDALVRDRIAAPVVLGALADEEIAMMLEFLWNRPPRQEELRELLRLGEGIPFFIEELAGLGGDGQKGRVPRSVEQAVDSRLRILGEEAVKVVQTASFLAGAIDPAVLAIACDLPRESVAQHLASAARAGALVDLDDRLVFRHALVRDAIAEGLVSVEAQETHQRLASAIEKIHADDIAPFSVALAHHYREAGNRERAARYAVRAGERSLAFAAMDEARAAFELALELTDGESIEAIRGLAETEFRDANESEAARLFTRAAEELAHRGENTNAALTLGRLAWTLQGRVDSADVLEVLDRGLRLLAGDHDSFEYAKLMVQKGGMLTFVLNKHDEAKPILEEAIVLAGRVGDQALVAEAMDSLALLAEAKGDWEEELQLGARAVEAATKSRSAEIIGRSHNNHAVCLSAAGRPREALAVLSDGRAFLEKAYGPAAVGALNVTRAWIAMLMGLPSEVEALIAGTGVAWQRWRAYRRFLEVWAAAQLGELERAESVLGAAWDEVGGESVRKSWLNPPSGPNPEASQILRAEVIVLLGRRRPSDALAPAQALVKIDSLGSERFDQGHSISLLARTLVSCGDLQAAGTELSRLESLAEKHNYPYLLAAASEIAGSRSLMLEEYASAVQAFVRAGSQFIDCDNTSDQARCERLISDAGLKAGLARNEIEQHLRRARKLAEQSGASEELQHIDAALRAMGIRPRAGRPRKGSPLAAGGLSPREAEVVALVAAGATNSDIARRLFLSDRTVQDHVTHALRKLRLPGRAALASWAVRNGMM